MYALLAVILFRLTGSFTALSVRGYMNDFYETKISLGMALTLFDALALCAGIDFKFFKDLKIGETKMELS